jgi:hypothetical protein
MQDTEILSEIKRLVDEEHSLLEKAGERELKAEEHARVRALDLSLEQCWDLLRQRRARREFGQDPADTDVRDATTVERYQQ